MSYIARFLSIIKQRLAKRRPGTVRTLFSFSFFGFVIFLGAAAINSNNASYIRLEASESVIKAGDSFSLDVFAYAHVPVNAVDVTLRFDRDAVSVSRVDRGESVLTIWTEDPIIEDDKVILRGGTFRKGFLGEHKIATIKLVASKTGQSEFTTANVLLLAGDGKGTPVKVAEATGSKLNLYVYDENQAPENIGVVAAVSVVTDLNGDGKVGLTDISSFLADWSSKDKIHDFNGDGRMSFQDFSIILVAAFRQS